MDEENKNLDRSLTPESHGTLKAGSVEIASRKQQDEGTKKTKRSSPQVLKKLKFWKKAKSQESLGAASETKQHGLLEPPPGPRSKSSSSTTRSTKSHHVGGRVSSPTTGAGSGGSLRPSHSSGHLAPPVAPLHGGGGDDGGRRRSPSGASAAAETTSIGGVSARAQKRRAHKPPPLSSSGGRRKNVPKVNPAIDDDGPSSPTGSVRTTGSRISTKPATMTKEGVLLDPKINAAITTNDEKAPLIASTTAGSGFGSGGGGRKRILQRGWRAVFSEPPTRGRGLRSSSTKPLIFLALVGCFVMGALYSSTVNLYQSPVERFTNAEHATGASGHNGNFGRLSEQRQLEDKEQEMENGNTGHIGGSKVAGNVTTTWNSTKRGNDTEEKPSERRHERNVVEAKNDREKEQEKEHKNTSKTFDKDRNERIWKKGSDKNESVPAEHHHGGETEFDKEDENNRNLSRKAEERASGKKEGNSRMPGSITGNAPRKRRCHISGGKNGSEGVCDGGGAAENLTDVQWAFIEHSAPAIVAVLAPIVGALTVFTPRLFLLLGLFLLGASNVAYGCVYLTESPIIFVRLSLILRLVQALGTASFAVAVFAVLATERHGNMAVVTAMALACVFAGCALGPVIYYGFLQATPDYDISGWVLGGLVVMLSVICCACVGSIGGRHTEKWLGRSPSMFSSIFLWLLAAITIVSGLSTSFYACRLFRTVCEVTSNTIYISLVVGGFVALYLITLFMFGALMIVRKASSWSYAILGLGLTSVGYFVAGPIPLFEFHAYLWSTGTSAGMLAVGFGMTQATLYSGMLDAANKVGRPDSLKLNAHVAGVFIGCLFFGVFLASVTADYVMPAIGWRWTTAVIGCLNVVLVLIVAIYKGWKVFVKKKRNFDDDYFAGAVVPPLVSYGSISGAAGAGFRPIGSRDTTDEYKQII